MNVYEIDIWCSVKNDGKFSHNARRTVLVHALNEERARKKITLSPAIKLGMGGQSTVEASKETIYSVRKTGAVKKQMFYVYSDGRNPRPVKG